MRKNNIGIIEEVGSDSKEVEKRKFFEGCSGIEKELNLKGLGVKLRKIWFTIPKEYKSGDSGAYDLRLEKEVKYLLDKMRGKDPC